MPPQKFSLFTAEPSFLFIFDLSLDALNTGFTQLAAATVLASLHRLADETFVGMLAVSHQLTIFDLQKDRRIVICELEEMEFSITPCRLGQCRSVICSSLEWLAKLTANADDRPGNCFGWALEATALILAVIGGVVLAFISSGSDLGPHAIAPRSREEMAHEPSLFKMPEAESSKFYRRIALQFSDLSISLSLFVASKAFVDLGVLALPCSATGGKCYFYSDFPRLHSDIYRILSAKYLWGASLKVRVSSGFIVQRMHGNGFLKSGDTVVLPAMLQADSFTFDLLPEVHVTKPTVVFQVVLNWTPGNRISMLRVFTFSLPVREDLASVVSHADEGAILAFLVKRILPTTIVEGPGIALNKFVTATKKMIPHQFKSLPLLTFGMLKSPLLRETCAARAGERISEIIKWRAYGIIDALLAAYPRLIRVEDQSVLPMIRDSFVSGVMLLHTVDFVAVWAPSVEALQKGAGAGLSAGSAVDIEALDGVWAREIAAIVRAAWDLSWKFLPVTAFVGIEPVEAYLREGTIGASFSMTNWTMHGMWT
jgi:hypothetical protein